MLLFWPMLARTLRSLEHSKAKQCRIRSAHGWSRHLQEFLAEVPRAVDDHGAAVLQSLLREAHVLDLLGVHL